MKDSSAHGHRHSLAWLWVVVGVALVLRLGWVLVQPPEPDWSTLPDQREYVELGRNLLAGRGLKFHDGRFDDVVHAYRTPGYPAFVALCGGNVRAVRTVQALIDSLTVIATYLLARHAGAMPNAGALAALFVAINPFLIYFTGLLLSETVFIALLVWAMVVLLSRQRVIAVAGGGVLLGMAVLVRPSALGMVPLLGLLAAVANRPAGTAYELRRMAGGVVVPLSVVVLMLLPWAWRNHRILGHWIWTTTNSGITAYDGFHPGATGASDQRFVESMPELRWMREVERSEYLQRLASQAIADDPLRAIRLAGVKIARTWSPAPLSREHGSARYRIVGLLYAIPLFVLAIAGVALVRLRVSVKLFLVLPAIYLTVVHSASVGSLRYRVPAEVPICVLAGCAAWMLLSLRTDRQESSTFRSQ